MPHTVRMHRTITDSRVCWSPVPWVCSTSTAPCRLRGTQSDSTPFSPSTSWAPRSCRVGRRAGEAGQEKKASVRQVGMLADGQANLVSSFNQGAALHSH